MREPAFWRCSPARSGRFSRLGALLGILGCGVLFVSLPVAAQAPADPSVRYSIPSSKAVTSLLLDITRAGDRLVAAGDRGHVLFSDDEGASWTQAKVPTRQMLTALHFVDAQHGWAVGHDALILATDDGGQTWTRQYEDLSIEAPLLDVWFENLEHGIAVGAYGAMLETTDGGETWEDIHDRLDNEDGFHLNAIAAVPGGDLFVVGEMGGLFRSSDQGVTWERLESPYEGSFFGVVGGHVPGSVLVFGLRGHLFRSTDGGDSWEQFSLDDEGGALEAGLAGGASLGDGRIVVVGHGGVVLTSEDKGRSFELHSRPDRRSLAAAAATSDGNLILVGQGGVQTASPTGADLAPSR